MWLNGKGKEFKPYTHYCVGGNSKFWGCVLYRLRREDFGEIRHLEGTSPPWPITYETMEPYYERAEAMYQVRGETGLDPTEPPRGPFPFPAVPHQGRMARIVDGLKEQGLHPAPLPLGVIRPGEPEGCILCDTCASFPCKLRMKSDADVCAVSPALGHENVTLWTNAYASKLLTNRSGDRVTGAQVVRDGEVVRVEAPLFVVSCGAINSTALLLRSANRAHPEGLGNSSGLLGRRYMAHYATLLGGFLPPKDDTAFPKTVGINDYYLEGPNGNHGLGHVQSQARGFADMALYGGPPVGRYLPRKLYDFWFDRGLEWLAMTEDLPSPHNRITLSMDGRIRLFHEPRNGKSHRELVKVARRFLRRAGFWFVVPTSLGSVNTTHQCGTAVFGTDPLESVLDPYCRSHELENLFVVDGSFFPSSGAVNPALTIAAQALRSADHILDHDLK
jgi:choline dehydrogenase-like flavoprotein